MEGKKCPMLPNEGFGFHLCNHVSELPNHVRNKDLKVSCKIMKLTSDKLIWDSYFETKAKLDETNVKLNECKRKQDETNAELVDAKTKLAKMDVNLEEAKTKIKDIRNAKKPPCPICFEEMSHETKIAQCYNGHFVCWTCKERMIKKDCPSCGLPVNGEFFTLSIFLWPGCFQF